MFLSLDGNYIVLYDERTGTKGGIANRSICVHVVDVHIDAIEIALIPIIPVIIADDRYLVAIDQYATDGNICASVLAVIRIYVSVDLDAVHIVALVDSNGVIVYFHVAEPGGRGGVTVIAGSVDIIVDIDAIVVGGAVDQVVLDDNIAIKDRMAGDTIVVWCCFHVGVDLNTGAVRIADDGVVANGHITGDAHRGVGVVGVQVVVDVHSIAVGGLDRVVDNAQWPGHEDR